MATQRIESAIRWEGNNLPDIRDFLTRLGMATYLETDGTKAHILIAEGKDIVLEIILEDGDGLLWDGHLLATARNIRYGDEFTQEDETVH